MKLDRLFYNHRIELTKYAARFADKFGLPDSSERHISEYAKRGESLYQSVHLKFHKRFLNSPEELKQLLEKELYVAYIKASIRNKAFDEKDKLKHTPTALVDNEIQGDEDGEYTDSLSNISDDQPEIDKILHFKDLLKIFLEKLSEEEEDLAYLCAKGLTSGEISEELHINSANTVRTKIRTMRDNHRNIRDLLNEFE